MDLLPLHAGSGYRWQGEEEEEEEEGEEAVEVDLEAARRRRGLPTAANAVPFESRAGDARLIVVYSVLLSFASLFLSGVGCGG